MNGKRILMTGGFGFIGSNFINYCIDNYEDFRIANLDFRGVGSNTNNVKQHDNVQHYDIDITSDFIKGSSLEDMPEIDYVINFAAESHVDRSISTPSPFVRSNVLGTMQMLEASKKLGAKRFIQVSTDEVYGSVDSPAKEDSPLNPSSVYSATKCGAEMLCNAYKQTFGLDIVITRCGNNFGPNQFDEKLIPKVITNAIKGEKIPVYDDGQQIREWVFVEDHVKDIIAVAENGKSGEAYNVGTGFPLCNLDLVKMILQILGKSTDLIEFKQNARPGHDFRYAIDTNKIIEIRGGDLYATEEKFKKHLTDTIQYYKNKS